MKEVRFSFIQLVQKHLEFIFVLEYFIKQKLFDTSEEDWEELY
jgi:hypothetical protein